MTFLLAVFCFFVSAMGVRMFISVSRRWAILDVPKERSSHAAPTPRLGGVPMVASAAFSFSIWVILVTGDSGSFRGIAGTAFFACGICILGIFDDIHDLSPLFQILVQFALCLFCLWLFRPVPPDLFTVGGAWIRWVLIGAASIWCVWMLNLYNFMDGIDGLAGGQAAMASLFFFLLFAWKGETGWAVANLMIFASTLGFLVFNWPPAKIFMGNSGSTFLGAFYGMQSLYAPGATGVPFIVLVLPFSNFIFDTTFTLLRRMLLGEKWYQAHRTHVYQRMTNLGMSHRKITIMELTAAAASSLAAALFMRANPFVRWFFPVLVFIGLACVGTYYFRKEVRRCADSSCSP